MWDHEYSGLKDNMCNGTKVEMVSFRESKQFGVAGLREQVGEW